MFVVLFVLWIFSLILGLCSFDVLIDLLRSWSWSWFGLGLGLCFCLYLGVILGLCIGFGIDLVLIFENSPFEILAKSKDQPIIVSQL